MALTGTTQARPALSAAAVRRHGVLVVVCALVFAGLGIAAAAATTSDYKSTTAVLVNPTQGNPYGTTARNDQLVNLETEAQIVGAEAVARIVADRIPRSSTGELRRRVKARVPTGTNVLLISYTAPSARGAQRGAQTYAEAYLTYRGEQSSQAAQEITGRIEEQQREVSDSIKETSQQLASARQGSARAIELNRRLDSLNERVAELDSQQSQVAEVDVDPGSVITPAPLPGSRGGLGPLVLGGAGLLVGLAIGLGLALIRELSDVHIRDHGDLAGLGVPALVSVPRTARRASEPVMMDSTATPASEAYRLMRTAVIAAVPARPLVLSVASVSARRSAAATATNLALALSRTGNRVVLVDADPVHDEVAGLLGLRPSAGLADVLLADVPLSRALESVPGTRLMFLGTGEAGSEAAEVYLDHSMSGLVDELRRRADFVVFASPPVASADGEAVASLVDAVIPTVVLGGTTHDEVVGAVDALSRMRVRLLGAVSVPADAHRLRPMRHPRSSSTRRPQLSADQEDSARADAQLGARR